MVTILSSRIHTRKLRVVPNIVLSRICIFSTDIYLGTESDLEDGRCDWRLLLAAELLGSQIWDTQSTAQYVNSIISQILHDLLTRNNWVRFQFHCFMRIHWLHHFTRNPGWCSSSMSPWTPQICIYYRNDSGGSYINIFTMQETLPPYQGFCFILHLYHHIWYILRARDQCISVKVFQTLGDIFSELCI